MTTNALIRTVLTFTLSLLLLHNCLAKETSFWSRIQAIEARSILSPSSSSSSSSSFSTPDHANALLPRGAAAASAHPALNIKCTHPVARVSWYALTSAEQTAWIRSFHALHTPGKSIFVRGGSFMDDLTLVHIGLQEEMHYNSCFLVCHTAFLRAFYSLMRVSGYKGREAYWDIEADSQNGLQNAAIWRWFGGDDGKGGAIPNGPFRRLKCGVLPNTKKPGYSVYKPHYVTRHFNGDWNRKPLIKGDMYTSHFTKDYFSSILASPNYTALRRKLEITIHAWIHQSIGGEMWMFSATCEPGFWLLHAEVDRTWRSWQTKTGKWFDYQGHKRIRRKDGTQVIKQASLDDVIDFYGLFEKVKVRDVMHPRRGIMCYRYDRLIGGGPDDQP